MNFFGLDLFRGITMKLYSLGVVNSLFYVMVFTYCPAIAQEIAQEQESAVPATKSVNQPVKNKVSTQLSLNRFAAFVEQYQQNIEELESKEGAYGPGLSQELLALGTFYQQNNKHVEAINSFKRSLHLKRINEGLYTKAQIPIVELLINSFAEKKQWRSVDNRFKYLNWLYQRNFAENAIENYPIKIQLANWHLKSFSLNRLEEPLIDLLNSYLAYNQATQILIETYGAKDLKLIPSLRGSLLVNYLIATSRIKEENLQVGSDGEITRNLNALASKVAHLQNRSLKQGLMLINHEIDIYLAQPTIDHHLVTDTKLKMADWYLMHGKRDSAMRNYQQAYHYLAEHSQDVQLIEQTFAQPVVLPNFENMDTGTSLVSANSKPADDVNYVHASLDITQYGTARNVKIVDSNLTNNATRSRVLRSLRKAKYRPKIAGGNMMPTAQMQLHVFP